MVLAGRHECRHNPGLHVRPAGSQPIDPLPLPAPALKARQCPTNIPQKELLMPTPSSVPDHARRLLLHQTTGPVRARWIGWRLLAFLAWLAVVPSSARAKEYALYYLGGQSNMDGYGQVSELPPEMQGEFPDAMIFHGNPTPDGQPVDGRGLWTRLQPGHGVGFSSDGKTNRYSNRFGAELSLARRLRELHPDQPVALLKYSRGGTSIDGGAAGDFGCWDPDYAAGEGEGRGVNQYDHFLAALRQATAVRDIDGDGEEDTLRPVGIFWMQGESDAHYTAEIALRYQANLRRLMDLIRASLRQDDIPVVIGRISDSGQDADGKLWNHGPLVRSAQQAFTEQDGRAALVTATDEFKYSDAAHYDTAGYLEMGKTFADALESIREQK
jgi:hypothetical protein